MCALLCTSDLVAVIPRRGGGGGSGKKEGEMSAGWRREEKRKRSARNRSALYPRRTQQSHRASAPRQSIPRRIISRRDAVRQASSAPAAGPCGFNVVVRDDDDDDGDEGRRRGSATTVKSSSVRWRSSGRFTRVKSSPDLDRDSDSDARGRPRSETMILRCLRQGIRGPGVATLVLAKTPRERGCHRRRAKAAAEHRLWTPGPCYRGSYRRGYLQLIV